MHYKGILLSCLACLLIIYLSTVTSPVVAAIKQEITSTNNETLNALALAQAMTTTAALTATSSVTTMNAVTMTSMPTVTAPLTATGETTSTGPISASAQLQDAQGKAVGTAIFREEADGMVTLAVTVTGLLTATAGEHGIHIHQIGRCTPDFAAAGEHFNPTVVKHGLQDPAGPHAGDLPNITFDAKGNATYTATTSLITLHDGPRSILAADGSALVIHAKADDQMSDPSGKSGGRIACGVIAAAPAPMTPPAVTGNTVEPEHRTPTAARIAQLKVPAGFTVKPFAQDLGNVRMMAQGPDGTIYLTRRAQGDVLALTDQNQDGMAEAPITVTAGLTGVHGILVHNNQLYLATPLTIYVASLQGAGKIGQLSVLVGNLPQAGQHGSRTMAFGPDGLLYVSIGSLCNACGETDKENAAILQIQPDGRSRTVFAKGLRNTLGFAWHPETGEMWGMDQGSDWRGDDQPPEELNRLQQGGNYGWPYCYAAKKVDPYLSVNPPGQTKAEYCAQTLAPVLTYQAHSSPISLVFYTGKQFPAAYQNDAFVTLRGSWNRQQPVGYKVVRLHFTNGKPVSFEDFLTGFLIENGKAQFGRPAGLLVLQDGSLLVSDDTSGVIYRITYAGTQK